MVAGPVGTNPVFRKASAPALSIPDNNPTGIKTPLVFTDMALIGSIKVSVDITHTYIGDLQINLITPSGTSVPLHQRFF